MMAGFVKAKKFLWKDTNLEMFGSDTEKQVREQDSFETIPTKWFSIHL